MAPYVVIQFKSLPPDQREWRVVASGKPFDVAYSLEYMGHPDAMGNHSWIRWGRDNLRGEESVPRSCFLGLAQLIDKAGK